VSVVEFVGVFWQGVRSLCPGSARDSEVLLHGSRRGSHPWVWLPLPLAVPLCSWGTGCVMRLSAGVQRLCISLFSAGAQVGQRQGARLGARLPSRISLVPRDIMQQACRYQGLLANEAGRNSRRIAGSTCGPWVPLNTPVSCHGTASVSAGCLVASVTPGRKCVGQLLAAAHWCTAERTCVCQLHLGSRAEKIGLLCMLLTESQAASNESSPG
jgi:hypothetical protein